MRRHSQQISYECTYFCTNVCIAKASTLNLQMLTLLLDIYVLYSDLPQYDLMKGVNMFKKKQTIINSTPYI